MGQFKGRLEMIEVALVVEACTAAGAYNGNVAGPRRLLNEAGERVCAVDRSFQSFEAHGGRGRTASCASSASRR